MKGLPKIYWKSHILCETCQEGKQIKAYFNYNDIVSTSRLLQLLHINLFEPTRMLSLGGKKYGFVIVDDCSRYTWVYFLAHKQGYF